MFQSTGFGHPMENPFVPEAETEGRCRAMLKEYVPKIVTPEHVQAHVDELLSLHGGFIDRFNYFARRMPDNAKARLLFSGCACGSEMLVARQYGYREIFGTEVVPELVAICQERLRAGKAFRRRFTTARTSLTRIIISRRWSRATSSSIRPRRATTFMSICAC